MIGYVPRTLLDMVRGHAGPEACRRVLGRAGLPEDADYRIDRHYGDEECMALIGAVCAELGIDAETACHVFAQHFMADAEARFPVFFRMSPNARALLMRQPRIHMSMASSVSNLPKQDGVRGHMAIRETEAGDLEVDYASPNRLGRLYRALAMAALARYGERAEVVTEDDIDGERVRFRIVWAPPAESHAAE